VSACTGAGAAVGVSVGADVGVSGGAVVVGVSACTDAGVAVGCVVGADVGVSGGAAVGVSSVRLPLYWSVLVSAYRSLGDEVAVFTETVGEGSVGAGSACSSALP